MLFGLGVGQPQDAPDYLLDGGGRTGSLQAAKHVGERGNPTPLEISPR